MHWNCFAYCGRVQTFSALFRGTSSRRGLISTDSTSYCDKMNGVTSIDLSS